MAESANLKLLKNKIASKNAFSIDSNDDDEFNK